MTKKIMIFGYSFVAGVALAMILHPEQVSPVSANILLYASAAALVCYLVFKKYSGIFLICFPLLFSASNYYRTIHIDPKNHISNFCDKKFFDRTFVTGTVVVEPDARDTNTKLTVRPESVEKPSKGGWVTIESSSALKGNTGRVLVTIYPSIGDYYTSVEYGDRIRVESALLAPAELRNPAGFDYGRFLRARNIHAVMYVRTPEAIQYLGPGRSDWLHRFAMKLKRRFLWVIKKTMPYPESAFLAGATFGSKGGIPPQMKAESQATGVGWVYAVAGMHVGFVYILIMMLCRAFRIHRKPTFFLMVLGIIIYGIITGFSPATRRAVLMLSIGQFAYTFGGLGVRMSSAITIPISAAIILFFDPVILPDGAFVLSYMAVWSLVYLSKPIEDVFKFLMRGWAFFVMLFWILASTGIAVVNPGLFLNRMFSAWYVICIIATATFAKLLNNKYPLENFDFDSLPKYFVRFTYAQLSIQLGMMLPLSAVYFKQFPVSGVYANYIAIPLVTYVVQLGLLADLFELLFSSLGLGALGLKAAFLVNSANYIFTKFFLDMAHFFATRFPYPLVGTPTPFEVTMYYSAILMFVSYKRIYYFLEGLYYRVQEVIHVPALRRRLYVLACAVPAAAIASYLIFAKPKNILKVTFLDAGFGSSVIVRTPAGKSILIDGGNGDSGGWNFGPSAVLPTFSKFKIHAVDKLVLTSPEAGNIGGLASVMDKIYVGEVWDVLDPAKFSADMSYSEFLTGLDVYDFKTNSYAERPSQIYEDYYEFLRAVGSNANRDLKKRHYRAKVGDVIHSEPGLKISVLWPPSEIYKYSGEVLDNNSLVIKITYGGVSFLLPSNIRRDAEWFLAETLSAELKSTVLLVPSHGDKDASSDAFIRAVSPEVVVLQYGYQKGKSFYESDLKYALERYASCVKGGGCFRTDSSGAVTVETDGKKYSVSSCLKNQGFGIASARSDFDNSEILNIYLQ